MLIYIIHNDYISTFRLPKDVSGNYMLSDIDTDDKNRSLINISSQNGKWYFNSNIDVGIYYNNNFVKEIEVAPYNFYTLNYFLKTEMIGRIPVTKSNFDNQQEIINKSMELLV